MKTKWAKRIVLIIVFGIVFNWIESMVSRGIIGATMVGFQVGPHTIKYWTLAGWSTLWMTFVGGVCGLWVDQLTEWEWSRKLPIIIKSLMGLLFVWAMEITTGSVLNIWLKLGVWDYSDEACNVLGQACLGHGIAFFAIMPFAIWLGDVVRYYRYDEEKPDKLIHYYKRLILLK